MRRFNFPRTGRLRRSLAFSFWDGIFSSATLGLTADYIAPYALALKATNAHIAFLSAIPSLVAALIQLKTADVVERFRSRKKIILLFVFLQIVMGVPIILVPYVFTWQPVAFLIFFVTLFNSFNAFCGPAWSSLMSDHVPYKSRGVYFGWRSKFLGIVTILSAFIAGWVLYVFQGDVLPGFALIFTAAFVFRCVSWYFLSRMYEPPFKSAPSAYFTFWDFISRIRASNFARFVVLVSALLFCVNIAAPFFSVFMLRDLKFNYLVYTVLVTTVIIAQIFTLSRWGRHADTVGNIKVLRLTAFLIATLPLWWLLSRHPLYLVIVQAIGGFAWAGFNLCATNFIYDAVRPDKRTRCIAYFNVCSGVAVCCGALTGGFLSNHMPNIFGYSIMTLFVISSALRLVVVGFFNRMVKEVRPAEAISSRDLFYSVIGLRPMPQAMIAGRGVRVEE